MNELRTKAATAASTVRVKAADLFCGAGGFSTGAVLALTAAGIEVDLDCVNHWDLAIATHKANHPNARHHCSDVYRLLPLDAVPGGELDLLLASPTCTYFSRARGGKPISRDQRYGRMTPTQVLRWLQDLDVRVLICENVPEFQEWCPVHQGAICDEDGNELVAAPPVRNRKCKKSGCKPGKPCRRKRGSYFRAWVRKIERLGYRVEWRVLCAADFGDATTRERLFLVARKDGLAIDWPMPTHSKHGHQDLYGAGGLRWRPAREIIDWSIEGDTIFRPEETRLADKTLERVYAGISRFTWPTVYQVALRAYIDREPLPPFALTQEPPATEPLVARTDMHKSNALCVRRASEPVATVTSGGGMAVVEPFVAVLRRHADGRSADRPLPTVCAGGGHMGVVEPFVLNRHGDNGAVRAHPVDRPTPTVTTHGAGYLVEPFVLPQRSDAPARSVDRPVPTATTVARIGLVEAAQPLVLGQHGGAVARSVTSPVPTLAADGAVSLIAPYYGASACTTVAQPLGTQTTKDRFGLVTPVTHTDGSRRERSVDEPLPTVTAANRGELAFIAASFGERKGQAPRVHSLEEPTPTLCAAGRVQLVTPAQGVRHEAAEGAQDQWYAEFMTAVTELGIDIRFRMLQPSELAAAMSFPKGYQIEGNKTEVTRQIGNAVAVRTAEALVRACVPAILGAQEVAA